MKKFISLLVVAAFALTLVPVAKADTISDLMAQIAALQAQIAALSGTTTTGTTCFSTNLKLGMRTADVKLLQEKLGVSNTGYFGPLTLAAVKTFQGANGVPTTGFVGELTRAKLNAKYCVAASTTTTTVAGTTGAATEGTFTAKLAVSPIDNTGTGINAGSNIPVYGISATAKYSDMTIDRADLQISVYDGSSYYNPANLISKISAYDGSTLLVERTLSTSDFVKDANGKYYVRLTGINFKVAKDATKVLTFSIDTNTSFDTNRNIVVQAYGVQGIRATDTLGLSTYADLSSATRSFLIKKGGAGSLATTANVNNPKENNIYVSSTSGLTDLTLLSFDNKATLDDVKITNVVVTNTGDTTPSSYKLYDGGTLLSSVTGVAKNATAAFNDLGIVVAKDTIKTLTIKADYPTSATATTTAAKLATSSVTYEKGNGTTANSVTGSDITGAIMHLYNEVPTFTFVSGTNVVTTPTSGTPYTTGTLTFKVKANGGVMTLPVSSDVAVVATNAAGATTTIAAPYVSVDTTTNIPDGSEATITVNASVTKDATNTGFVYFKLASMKWIVGSTQATTTPQSWGFADFKTNAANLQ